MKYKKILFVCGMNQYRSPIAEAIFKDIVSKDPELCSEGIEVKSAGISLGIDGAPVIEDAVKVIKGYGLDISSHRAKHINLRLVNWADIILVMERHYERYIKHEFPRAKEKVYLLTEFTGDTGDVYAPTGNGLEPYGECIKLLRSLLNTAVEIMKENIPP